MVFTKGKEQRAIALSVEDAKKLLSMMKDRSDPVYYHIALWQMTSHRQRIGEVLSLEWPDVDWENEIAWITGTMLWTDKDNKTTRNTKQYHTKEGRPRIPINFGGNNQHLKKSLLALEALKRGKRWVFADQRGNVPTLRQINGIYKKSGLFQEKGLATHKCRKTALTLATIKCGVEFAKRLGGHSADSAHVRYIDRQMKEMENPVPAKLAEALGLT
jgi:integrase